MGSPQLYYTSCERGLSGFTGYQFNAATPGVDVRVLCEVERFTVYEPPRSLPPDQVHRHPVNLCYSPDLGGVRVLSRVISSGDDPSGRPGNYFAHSLLLDGAAEPLPAELWGAPFWAGRPVSEPNLPGLAVAPGPLDRERTAAWLRGRDEVTLRRLLVAVDAAIDDGPPVLLLAQDEEAAHWMAALSHLLPPRRALRMSFATYSGSPEDTLVHVMAVPPETDIRGLRSSFVIFGAACLDRAPSGGVGWTGTDRAASDRANPDRANPDRAGTDRAGTDRASTDRANPDRASTDRASTDRASTDTITVVSTLVRAGVRRAPALWADARPYASGREDALAQWRPPLDAASLATRSLSTDSVAAAQTDHSASTTTPDLRALRVWLPEAVAWLPPELSRRLLDRLLTLDPESPRDDELARLQDVAHTCGSPVLTERLEGLIVGRVLDRILTGSPAPPMAPRRSSPMSAAAGERVGVLFAGGSEWVLEPERAAELLRWARAGGVPLPEASMRHYGAELIALRLAEHPPWAEPDPHLAALVTEHAPVRQGAAHGLSRLPRRALAELVTGPVGALFALDRDASTALLRELRVLHTRRYGRRDPLRLLRGVVSLRVRARPQPQAPPRLPEHDLDRELLLRVWGTAAEAAAVVASLSVVDERTLVAPDVGLWCATVLSHVPSREQEGWWRQALSSPAYRSLPLPPQGQGLLRDWRRVEAQVDTLERAPGAEQPRALAELTARARGCGPAVAGIVSRRIGDRLLCWDEYLSARVLATCDPEVFDAYHRAVAERLTLPPKRTLTRSVRPLEGELVARVFLVARRLGGTTTERGSTAERGRDLLVNVLEPASLTWSRRDTATAREAFDHPEEEHAFQRWVHRARGRAGRGGLFGRPWKAER